MKKNQQKNSLSPIRQGDVLLSPASAATLLPYEHQLPHLVLAEGEVTGHSHRIAEGEAMLYRRTDHLLLRVFSPSALLVHEEHQPVTIPQGTWMVRIQREYQPGPVKYRHVSD